MQPGFQWQYNTSRTKILAIYVAPWGSKGAALDSMIIVPCSVKSDNSGPPSSLEVTKNYATLKGLFPGATILASDCARTNTTSGWSAHC